jgi:hypothetical protein
MCVVIVVEVDPGPLRPTSLDPVRPLRELFLRIIMPVPALGTMQADIHFIGRANELVRQSGAAAGAEYYASFAKSAVNLLVPPALVSEFDDVAARRIELADNVIEPGLGVAVAWRQLKQKASHAAAQDVGDDSEIPD